MHMYHGWAAVRPQAEHSCGPYYQDRPSSCRNRTFIPSVPSNTTLPISYNSVARHGQPCLCNPSSIHRLCNVLCSAHLPLRKLQNTHITRTEQAHTNANTRQLQYRLQVCGELCTGLFTSAYLTSPGPLGDIIKARKFQSIDSKDSDRKKVLLGHIIATKSAAKLVTDEAMDYPKDWQTNYQLTPSTGHNEDGQTVCIHSLCVHPNFSGRGLGQVLLKGYIQRIRDSGVAKRAALICRDRLVGFYEKAGFRKVGPSQCQYGGGNWVDMVLDFESGMGDDEPDF